MIADIRRPQAQAILVVESPHTTELTTRIALTGSSGMVVSRTLIGRNIPTVPIGRLCTDGSVNLSIVNTFSQPIKFDAESEDRPQLLRDLHTISSSNWVHAGKDHKNHKEDVKQLLDNCTDNSILLDYKQRLIQALSAAAQKKIVVCGLLAQSVFEWTFSINTSTFTRPFNCRIDSKPVHVFYIWHPSPESGDGGVSAWEMPRNAGALSRLRHFIGPLVSL